MCIDRGSFIFGIFIMNYGFIYIYIYKNILNIAPSLISLKHNIIYLAHINIELNTSIDIYLIYRLQKG